jgi:hypothetical protein
MQAILAEEKAVECLVILNTIPGEYRDLVIDRVTIVKIAGWPGTWL